jgi:signal transduction histidine kinase
MHSWADRRTLAALGAGGALTALYFAVPPASPQYVIYGIVGAGAALVIAWGGWTSVPWLLFAAGNALFSVGDNISNALGGSPPAPSAADWFYLAGYPVIAAGFVLLLWSVGGHRRLPALVDAAIVTVAFLLVQWVYLIDAIWDNGALPTDERLVTAAYPIMDLILLAGLAGFFVTAAWRTPAFFLLGAAVALLLVGDEIYAFGSYEAGDWIDAMWLLSYVVWAAAALHPSRARLEGSLGSAQQRVGVGSGRIVALTAALLTAPTVLLVQHLRGHDQHVPAVVAAAAAISVFVVLRLVEILRALDRIRARERNARADAEQAQRLLEAQNERLVEADRMKDEFVALISHDLRTPLTSIMGYVELSLDEDLGADARSFLEVVARSSQRLLRLVDDLLFVARLQSGRLEIAPTRLDLTEIACQAAEEARGRADAKDLELVVDVNGAVPVDVDRGRVFQLLDNLISNAIKFTPDGGRVEIKVARSDDAVLEVCDTGIGFTEQEAARVFERFYRTDRAVERQVPGTGLGLFIAAAIADVHGGRISAHPRDGGGAVFRVELPLAP